MSGRQQLVCDAPARPPRLSLRRAAMPEPTRDHVVVRVEATPVNPIDVKRAAGYGQRLLGLKGAASFPLVLGNDLAGVVQAVGPGCGRWRVGERVFGLVPTGPQGAHATHVLANASHLRAAPHDYGSAELATLPYSFTTLWLALQRIGLTPRGARGRAVLVAGASGALGRLALQVLGHWGARTTAVCSTAGVQACRDLGAQAVLDRTSGAISSLPAEFDASLNFGAWHDEAELIGRLRPGALGHATTVHPLLGSFDEHGWLGGALRARREWSHMRARVAATGKAARYAWVLFQPSAEALDALESMLAVLRLVLPIGLSVPLAEGPRAFNHTEERRPGRAVLMPG
ncbi:MAG TPA: alcohol dehydrogenase catalytic domain-containing protein [Steroidobacteraceae bacterium]|nr:alcohol dehydrogenase catalytic domain-containing protein [Steroidobacteraceae bacterium]